MNTIPGYEFAVADNTIYSPAAIGAQNEAPMPAPLDESEPEDATLVASGLLPRLVEQARNEVTRDAIDALGRLLNDPPVTDDVWDRIIEEPYG